MAYGTFSAVLVSPGSGPIARDAHSIADSIADLIADLIAYATGLSDKLR
jgi:hypothetical protein